MNITVNPLTAEDLSWVIVADQDFPHPWSSESWLKLTENQQCFIAKADGERVGFALFQHLKGDDQAHLLKIYVNPAVRSQGISQDLFQESLASMSVSEVFLEVGETNVVAQRFYEKMGFVKIHLAKGFYSDGENAWFMTLAH